jgi:PIN domain nuclease of toxin-antitoxin system
VIALDASALLAFLFREPGHEKVSRRIEESCISAVNVAEVLARFSRDGHDAAAVLERLQSTSIEIVVFDSAAAAASAELAPATRKAGLSLGDRACLALARARSIPALTADRTWSGLELGISIEVVR